MEQSIECYRLALEVRTRAAYPEDWAGTQNNLAGAYGDRIRGERAANLEQSFASVYHEVIECYRLALEVRTRAAYPEMWAGTQMNLAVAYRSRIRGERAANLEQSFASAYHEVIECYRLALEVRTRAAYPEMWAATQNNLATLYAGKGQNEVAIYHYQQALEIFTPTAFPINALTANRGLGNIYFRQGSWQLAIHAYETAMQAVETSRSWVVNEESRHLPPHRPNTTPKSHRSGISTISPQNNRVSPHT